MTQQVWVFKTNIKHEADKQRVAEVLNHAHIIQWTVDMDDCDAVLRVVTTLFSPQDIIDLIIHKGYICSELTDEY